MDKVIGLGRLGCLVAEELAQRPEYRVYKIDSNIAERGSLSLGTYESLDDYESEVDTSEVEIYLRSIKKDDEILLIVEGGDLVSGAALSILGCVKDARINVLYIAPDREMCSDIQKRDDKIVFNVLQEYARSGMFEAIYLVHKPSVEVLVGDVTIKEYEKAVCYLISYVMAMINYFNHSEPALSNRMSPPDICRLRTLGLSSLDPKNKSVKLLFPMERIRGIHFYYGIPEKDLGSNPKLISQIKEHVKDHNSDTLGTSFSVYPTTFEDMFVLCEAFSSQVQGFAFSE